MDLFYIALITEWRHKKIGCKYFDIVKGDFFSRAPGNFILLAFILLLELIIYKSLVL